MSEWFNAGRISPVPSGTWNDTTEYKRLDIVTDPNMQRSYIAKKDVPAGTPLTDTEHWQMLVDAFHAVSLKTAADRLASPFSENGDIVICHPVEDYPLGVVTHIEPEQEGSGDPSPDNIRPITGHTGDVLTRCGKNLIPDDKLTTQDKNIRAYFGDPEGFLLYAGVTYTLSLGSTPANAVYVTTMDKAGGDGDIAKAYSKTSLTFTPSKDVRAQFNAYWTNGRPTDAYMMLELGSTATTYATYNGETFTTDFGQTVYSGTYDWNTGVLTVDRVLHTFDGTEAWKHMALSSTAMQHYVDLSGVQNDQTKANVISNIAKAIVIDDRTLDDSNMSVYSHTTGIAFRFDNIKTNADWKSYLAAQYAAGTPVQVAYISATPTTIQLAPQQIFALRGTNTLYSDCGETEVSGRIAPEWIHEQLKNAIIALGGNV